MNDRPVCAPDGMYDALHDECQRRHDITKHMRGLFAEGGFSEVSTPELEYYELFLRTGSPLPEESMYKVIDRSGRVCVLRPDSTTPIARLAATRLASQPLPLRLCYTQPVFRSGVSFAGSRNGVWQAGVEMIGSCGPEADREILTLAAQALCLLGGQCHIEIGHAGLFTALCGELSLPQSRREQLRGLIERKSFAALDDALEAYGGHPAAKDLQTLMRLSGGGEVLEEAALSLSDCLIAPLGELRGLLAGLPEKHFSFDLGITQPIEYYTGIVFRGYIAGAAAAVLQGGRYDQLLCLLGRDAPAIGFAVNLEDARQGS